MDYQKLLDAIKFFGLGSSTSIKRLKKRYKILAKEFHPDRSGDDDKMKKINDYYKILMEYLESVEISLDENSIARSSPEAMMYFQFLHKKDRDTRIGY